MADVDLRAHPLTQLIACGCSDPDPRVEARIVAARRAANEPEGFNGCGGQLVLFHAYRCIDCGRWMHRDCLRAHFGWTAHDHPPSQPHVERMAV